MIPRYGYYTYLQDLEDRPWWCQYNSGFYHPKKIRSQYPKLSRNYGTNEHMLPYKRIQEYFFMDKFFATNKSGKYLGVHTFCQLFVTAKGFVYVVPMKSKYEVLNSRFVCAVICTGLQRRKSVLILFLVVF